MQLILFNVNASSERPGITRGMTDIWGKFLAGRGESGQLTHRRLGNSDGNCGLSRQAVGGRTIMETHRDIVF